MRKMCENFISFHFSIFSRIFQFVLYCIYLCVQCRVREHTKRDLLAELRWNAVWLNDVPALSCVLHLNFIIGPSLSDFRACCIVENLKAFTNNASNVFFFASILMLLMFVVAFIINSLNSIDITPCSSSSFGFIQFPLQSWLRNEKKKWFTSDHVVFNPLSVIMATFLFSCRWVVERK